MATTSFPKPPIKTKRKSKTSKQIVISIFAITLAVIAIVIAIFSWQQVTSMQSIVHSQKNQFQQSMSELKKEVLASQSKLQDAISLNQKNISQLMSQGGDTAMEQSMGEASYLIRLAHLNLTMDNNIPLATKLLKMAALRLDNVNTSSGKRLKAAIEHDLATLSASPQVDRINLLVKLDRVSDEIANLPTRRQIASQPTKPIPESSSSQHWWSKVKHNLSGLKQLFIVRHFDKPTAPLLMPQQVIFLKDNIRLKITQAEWAVLHRSPKLYRQSLNTALQWLNQYNQNEPATQQVIKKLQALALIDITPQTPSTLKSLQMLNSLSSLNQEDGSKSTQDQTESTNQ